MPFPRERFADYRRSRVIVQEHRGAARLLREPIARYGPFVMNTREEIVQAAQDYERGTFLGEA